VITDSTISGNVATETGGGIYLVGIDNDNPRGTTYMSLQNTIVAGNSAAGGGPDIENPGYEAIMTASFSLVGNLSASGVVPTAPISRARPPSSGRWRITAGRRTRCCPPTTVR
jgi:predicted outer membrane repeat protein